MGRIRGENSLYFGTGLDTSGVMKGAGDVVGIMQNMTSKIASLNPFAALAGFAVTAFATIANEAKNMMQEFQHSMKEVETISSSVQKDFQGMSSQVFALSKITTDKPAELAKAFYQIVSSGYDGAKGLRLLEVASKAAVGGVTDTKTAADGLTTVMNAFKISVEESERVADVMFQTVKLGKTDFSQLSSNIAQVAPIAAASGVSFEQVAAAVATLTKQGVPTAQAMTQIRAAITSTNEVLGDGWSQTMSLQDAFQELNNRANGSQKELTNMVGRVEAVSAVLGIAGQNAKGAKADLEEMNNAVGASGEAFNRMASSATNQWAIFHNKIKGSLEGLGNYMVEFSGGFVRLFNRMLEETESLTEEVAKQATEYDILKSSLLDTNIAFSEKLSILQQLKNDYPDYLESLDLDKIKNEDLEPVLLKIKEALGGINEEYERRLELAGFEDSVNKAKKKKETYENLYKTDLNNFTIAAKEASDYAKQNKIELNIDWSNSPQEIYDQVRKAFITEDNDGLLSEFLDKRNRMVTKLFHLKEGVSIYKKRLRGATELEQQETEELKKQTIALRDNAKGYREVVSEINKVKNSENLKNFESYKFEKIKEALSKRKEILSTIEEIHNIDKKDYRKNPKSLAKYLKNENEEIKAEAQKRINTLRGLRSVRPKTDDELKTYTKILQDKQKAYETYENYKIKLGEEVANKRYANLLKEGANYEKFLQNQLKKYKSHQGRVDAIVETAAKGKYSLGKVEVKTIGPKKIDSGLDLNKTKFDKIAESIQKEKDIYSDLHRSLSDMRNKELFQYIRNHKQKLAALKEYIKAEKQRIKTEGLSGKKLDNANQSIENTIKQVEEAEGKIASATKQIGSNIQESFNQISDSFNNLSSLFKKFGDEDTSNLMNQIAGVAAGGGQLAAGIASGNPMAIANGAMQILDSAISVEVVSDTAKFETALNNLNKSINKLDYTIGKAYGTQEITARQSKLRELADLRNKAKQAEEAERNARKEVKLLGIRVGKKGKGSGTDQAKIEEFQKQAEEARRQAETVQKEIAELLTGATERTLADSIIAGFREGKRGAEDFASSFEDMMREAMIKTLEREVLAEESKEFFKKLEDLSDNEIEVDVFGTILKGPGKDGKNDLTSDEIKQLRDDQNQRLKKIMAKADILDEVLKGAGIEEGLSNKGKKDKKTLSASIQTITEDSANILAGTTNSILISVQQSTETAMKSLEQLSIIAQNTSYNHYLEKLVDLNTRLQNIETLLR